MRSSFAALWIRSLTKPELLTLVADVKRDDPTAVSQAVAFVCAERFGMWHNRARARLCRHFKNHPPPQRDCDLLVDAIIKRLLDSNFYEQFKDQLAMAIRFSPDRLSDAAQLAFDSDRDYIRRYAQWVHHSLNSTHTIEIADNHSMHRSGGGQFFRLLASRSPPPGDRYRYPTGRCTPSRYPMQFRLSSLLWLTFFAAILFAVAQLPVRRFPDAVLVVAILSFPLALIGLALLVFSVFMGFSIWVTPSADFHRGENLRNCGRMLAGGVAAALPFTYFLTSFIRGAPL
ncbi:hypothetical protein LF1_52120 [Rubripirellula obstinata]|uniref:Uncharacterized protein n=1 Tax=Rubripirellula obstinata TaxID=406547 RepID=A0A5B1CD75_9BACT|nr:hypothetical protein [Rubripirellula obstinata]KAA1257363.1 hypothetical protein LF1_52120 [Rubripirellula obstinata]